MRAFWAISLLQCLIVILLFLGDIGFDKPGRFGLAFQHFLILMFAQVCMVVVAATILVRGKQWRYSIAQLLLVLLTGLAVATQ